VLGAVIASRSAKTGITVKELIEFLRLAARLSQLFSRLGLVERAPIATDRSYPKLLLEQRVFDALPPTRPPCLAHGCTFGHAV